ncbi:MAG TPA: thermonuclease family protein [Myxococcota bacterium]|nr:thermonuclease family protein [Myxococcota bacterium]
MPLPFRVFRGNLYAVGFKPDGDTITFKPNDAAAAAALPNTDGNSGTLAVEADKNNGVSVRLQGIDALETHYQPMVGENRPAGAATPAVPKPSAGNHEQRRDLARAAANALLGMLGVTVTPADWHSWGYLQRVRVGTELRTEKFSDNVEVVVVANTVDSNGRILGWVFPASVALTEGQLLTEVQLKGLLSKCCNTLLLKEGWAYPYYFMTVNNGLRSKLTTAVKAAQRDAKGVWAVDQTAAGVAIPDCTTLHDSAVILPYLFRKLLRAWRMQALATWWAGGDVSPAAMEVLDVGLLFTTGNPYIYTVSDKQFLRLSEVVQVEGGMLKLLRQPQDIVFLE